MQMIIIERRIDETRILVLISLTGSKRRYRAASARTEFGIAIAGSAINRIVAYVRWMIFFNAIDSIVAIGDDIIPDFKAGLEIRIDGGEPAFGAIDNSIRMSLALGAGAVVDPVTAPDDRAIEHVKPAAPDADGDAVIAAMNERSIALDTYRLIPIDAQIAGIFDLRVELNAFIVFTEWSGVIVCLLKAFVGKTGRDQKNDRHKRPRKFSSHKSSVQRPLNLV